MGIEKEIYAAPSLDDDVKVASESAAEEAELELKQLIKQFEEWSKKNSSIEKYGDLIDAWVRKIDVMEDESLTDYINRIRAAEKKND